MISPMSVIRQNPVSRAGPAVATAAFSRGLRLFSYEETFFLVIDFCSGVCSTRFLPEKSKMRPKVQDDVVAPVGRSPDRRQRW